MIVRNGMIFHEEGKFICGSVRMEAGKIQEVTTLKELEAGEGEEVIEAEGRYVIPGLVDIHFHGCVGYDFCDGTVEAMDAITQYEAEHGVTSISPATMTLSEKELSRIFENAGRYKNDRGSTIRGITMEGPFVSSAKKGAQNGKYIHKPDLRFYKKMQELSGGMIKQVAVAPEEDKDLEFIKAVNGEVVASVAHTTADYDTADAAFQAGATHVTHLFNAMPPFTHREPGVVGAALDHEKVFAELICDGIHIHPSMVRAAFKMFGPDRICMISDSMMAAGMPDGDYSLGGQAVKVTGKLAVLENGTIAGSASNLMDCLRVAVKEMKIPLEQAVQASTLTPARSLGLQKECGSITVGKAADLVILDQELNIVQVIKDGRLF